MLIDIFVLLKNISFSALAVSLHSELHSTIRKNRHKFSELRNSQEAKKYFPRAHQKTALRSISTFGAMIAISLLAKLAIKQGERQKAIARSVVFIPRGCDSPQGFLQILGFCCDEFVKSRKMTFGNVATFALVQKRLVSTASPGFLSSGRSRSLRGCFARLREQAAKSPGEKSSRARALTSWSPPGGS